MSGRLIAALCLLMACDGIGRSVVGELGVLEVESCEKPVPCEPIIVDEPRDLPQPAAPVDVMLCGQAAAMPCTTSGNTSVAQCAASALALSLRFQGALDLAHLACSAVQLVHAADDPSDVRIDFQAWDHVHLDIESTQAVTLELAGGQIEQVSISLRGPINLRLLDSERVHDLRIQADSAAAQIELLRTKVASLSIDAPEAQVLLRRSDLEYVQLSARRLELESSSVSDASWSAATLNASDATLFRVRSEVERTVLSACDVNMGSFLSCQSLTAVSGTMTDVHLPACAEAIGIYGGAVVHSQLEGDLLLDAASLTTLALGVGEAGAIRTWDTHLYNISFCADQQPLTFAGASAAACVHCDVTPVPAQPAACQLDDEGRRAEDTYGCTTLFVIPPCEPPAPERMRPPRR
jgi:hypothetical protein